MLESFKPFGFRESNGDLVGFDVDLARDVAKMLNVKLELVPVTSANRMQLLQQGRIDVIIGAMGDNADRRKIVGMVEPHYFASGPNVLAKAGAFKDWLDLRGQAVCTKQGLAYIRLVQQEFGAKILAFADLPEALQALRTNRCAAMLTDDFQAASLLATDDWKGWEAPLPPREQMGWSIGVPLGEQSSAFGLLMAGAVYNWHASGKFVELGKKWQVAGAWLKAMNDRFNSNLR